AVVAGELRKVKILDQQPKLISRVTLQVLNFWGEPEFTKITFPLGEAAQVSTVKIKVKQQFFYKFVLDHTVVKIAFELGHHSFQAGAFTIGHQFAVDQIIKLRYARPMCQFNIFKCPVQLVVKD